MKPTGWISLSCENTSSCANVDYGVKNDSQGRLTGYAWAENVGWISFSCENNGSCAHAQYAVEIDPATGKFQGYAWGENIGWMTFESAVLGPSAVKTSWPSIDGTCRTDFDRDADVDGMDLAVWAARRTDVQPAELALEYGKTNCGE